MKTFRICDRLPFQFLRPLAQEAQYTGQFLWTFQDKNLRAVATDEFRPPRKGEFYLSGAEIEAYRAPRDLSTLYRIAHIVLIKMVNLEIVCPLANQPSVEA